jgi:hypothetical protein
MALSKRRQMEGTVHIMNLMNQWFKGAPEFLEIESQKPDTVRLYRLTSHNGSKNLSTLLTISEMTHFVDGMATMLSLNMSTTAQQERAQRSELMNVTGTYGNDDTWKAEYFQMCLNRIPPETIYL